MLIITVIRIFFSQFRFLLLTCLLTWRPVCPVMFQQPSACPVCQTQTGQADWPFSVSRLSRHVFGETLHIWRNVAHLVKCRAFRQLVRCAAHLPKCADWSNAPSVHMHINNVSV